MLKLHGWVWCGLIPAWAGKTARRWPSSMPQGAHPRVGGENEVQRIITSSVAGSSPRGRGKPLPSLIAALDGGLIPAWAGKTVGH